MKKFYPIILIFLFFSCTNIFNPRRDMAPDKVFAKWQYYAQIKDINNMIKYEDLYFNNVINCFQIYYNKEWSKGTKAEKKEFIKLYRKTLKKILKEKDTNWFDTFLRLNKAYNLTATHYTVDLLDNTAYLWLSYSYPGNERIVFKKRNGKWYIVNPFNYHFYINMQQTLIKQKR